MRRDTTQPALPALTADLLRDNDLLVDNLFADIWKQMRMETLLNRAGFKKSVRERRSRGWYFPSCYGSG